MCMLVRVSYRILGGGGGGGGGNSDPWFEEAWVAMGSGGKGAK